MPTWSDILTEISSGSSHDIVRRRYLSKLYEHTKRNTIIYYSGWLQKTDVFRQMPFDFMLNDGDKNGLMATIYKMDRTKGLDLILHTPGGDMAATESLIDYLRSMFGTDIRVIVPQIAMSGGTMIALAAKEIVMGKHSNLGPIDPQFAAAPAHAIKEEFEKAMTAARTDPSTVPIWQVLLSKYPPASIGESLKVIAWADQMTQEWLKTGMFAGDPDAQAKAARIVSELGDHSITKSHARHISLAQAQSLDLKVTPLEDDQDLQEAVLSVHHSAIITLNMTPAVKIIENHQGIAFISSAQQMLMLQQR
jgi:hypothetical protein